VYEISIKEISNETLSRKDNEWVVTVVATLF
jgi:hypothetical protein